MIGPMCRSVEDCAVVFNAIYGPDGRDETVIDAPFTWNPELPVSKLRIGYVKSELDQGAPAPAGAAGSGAGRAGGPSPEDLQKQREERLRIFADVLEVYRKAGATLEPIDIPAKITSIASAGGTDGDGATL